MKFATAEDLWSTCRYPENGKPLGKKNTRMYKEERLGNPNAWYTVRLHGNPIISITKYGHQLSHCGWKSITTKQRLNQFTPYTIYQKDWEWFVTTSQGTYQFIGGMFIDNEGYAYETYSTVWGPPMQRERMKPLEE